MVEIRLRYYLIGSKICTVALPIGKMICSGVIPLDYIEVAINLVDTL
jgi:hypothetical protein